MISIINSSWSLVSAQKISFTEQEKHSNQSSIITKARYVSFPTIHVYSIRYKSWMLKAGPVPTRIQPYLEADQCTWPFNLEIEASPARKQLETKMETTRYSFGGTYCLYTAVLISSVQSNPQSDPKSRVTGFTNPPTWRLQEVNRPEQVTVTLKKLWHKIC